MRSTIVPAQVTTVEDRVAGRLGLSQLILLAAPVFLGSILYVILPPFFEYHVYKIVLMVVLAVACGLLAVRVKGQILLLWLIMLVRYNLRPRYFVYSKNSLHGRDKVEPIKSEEVADNGAKAPVTAHPKLPQLSTAELVKIEELLANPQANVRFTTNRKGELRVHITEGQA
jgi:hypothetical protein